MCIRSVIFMQLFNYCSQLLWKWNLVQLCHHLHLEELVEESSWIFPIPTSLSTPMSSSLITLNSTSLANSAPNPSATVAAYFGNPLHSLPDFMADRLKTLSVPVLASNAPLLILSTSKDCALVGRIPGACQNISAMIASVSEQPSLHHKTPTSITMHVQKVSVLRHFMAGEILFSTFWLPCNVASFLPSPMRLVRGQYIENFQCDNRFREK